MPLKPAKAGGIPFVFDQEEIAEFFDEKGRFHLKRLRDKQAEKALQVALLDHGVVTRYSEQVYEYAKPIRFSLVKARRTHWGYYLMTIEYVYEGVHWQQLFRFERNSGGGLSGILYFNSSRRRKVAK